MERCRDCGAHESETALIFARRLVARRWLMVVECVDYAGCQKRQRRRAQQLAGAKA